MNGITKSERFVADLCQRSFLKLWTHPNPMGKKGKELCDCLIVCDIHIIIISVKEIEYKDTGDETGFQRWKKAAIIKSFSQIVGAERWLKTVKTIERKDGRRISLPPKEIRKYHRISVSLGSKGQVLMEWGDFGDGFIHLFDETSVEVVFKALDTITDFVEFLSAVEELIKSDTTIIFNGGGIEDLLPNFIMNHNKIDFSNGLNEKLSLLILENDLWKEFEESKEYKEIKNFIKESYIWDSLIEIYVKDLLSGEMFDMHSKKVTENELVFVTMALQPRTYRAELSKAFLEFINKPELKIASRVVGGYKNTAFVFLIGKSCDREARAQELLLRCYVVQGKIRDVKTVVGIATDRPGTSDVGYSSDFVYLYFQDCNEEMKKKASEIQEEFRYFENL